MPTIRVGVVNPTESEKVTMAVPDDIPVDNLTDAMVDAMSLPLRGNNGRRLNYHLNRRTPDGNLERLEPGETLGESEVQDGDALSLTVEMVAGGESSSYSDEVVGFFYHEILWV